MEAQSKKGLVWTVVGFCVGITVLIITFVLVSVLEIWTVSKTTSLILGFVAAIIGALMIVFTDRFSDGREYAISGWGYILNIAACGMGLVLILCGIISF